MPSSHPEPVAPGLAAHSIAADAVGPEPKKLYLPGLNGLRALAALAVVVSHTGLEMRAFGIDQTSRTPLAGYGVTMFFVLSGFLISLLLLLERERFGRLDIRKFYWRRVLRIWPLYYGYLALCVAAIVASHTPLAPGGLLLTAFLMPNVAAAVQSPMPYATHFWSLGVEEQFYLFWPFFLQWCLLPRPLSRASSGAGSEPLAQEAAVEPAVEMVRAVGRAARSIAVFLVLFLALRVALRVLLPGTVLGALALNTRFDSMALGALGACLVFRRQGPREAQLLALAHSIPAQAGAWTCVAWVAQGSFHVPFLRDSFGLDDALFAWASLILILNVSLNPRAWPRLRWAPLDFLGRISFGIYVYHMLLIGLLAHGLRGLELAPAAKVPLVYALVLGSTILVAALSYRFYERPFIQRKERFSRVHSSNEAPTVISAQA